ncbi:MAG: hypothetical protein JRJ00_14655, partial [Deltaproteobacteria bacterium]|nr:hypothetical protein [Deltaproteobacteria bacterium]
MEKYNEPDKKINYPAILLFCSIFGIYILLRIILWRKTVLFEDSDSVFYLNNIRTFLTFKIDEILSLNPDTNPFFPFWGAVFSLAGKNEIFGARATSLFFSCLLFIANIGVMKRVVRDNLPVYFGLLLLSFSPVLLPLSISVLTEPSYTGMVYLGLWLFLWQCNHPSAKTGLLIGLVAGMVFLCRTEGLIYSVVFPFFQLLHLYLKRSSYSVKKYMQWSIAFTSCFLIVAVPQILIVSKKMGTYALNGRVVHQRILANQEGDSHTEKMFSLDYSNRQVNIDYLRYNPQDYHKLKTKSDIKHIVEIFKRSLRKFDDFYSAKLGKIVGPLGIVLFSFGLLYLLSAEKIFELLLILFFLSVNLIPSLITP